MADRSTARQHQGALEQQDCPVRIFETIRHSLRGKVQQPGSTSILRFASRAYMLRMHSSAVLPCVKVQQPGLTPTLLLPANHASTIIVYVCPPLRTWTRPKCAFPASQKVMYMFILMHFSHHVRLTHHFWDISSAYKLVFGPTWHSATAAI